MRPLRALQHHVTHSRARACLTGSRSSWVYSKTLVSTKTSALIHFVPGQVRAVGAAPRLELERFAHGLLVCVFLPHLVAQDLAQHPGDAGVALGRLDARPLERV